MLVIAPSSIAQPIGLSFACTPHAAIDVPSNSTTGLAKVCWPLASQAPHVGGRTPVTLTGFSPTVPVSLPPAAFRLTTFLGLSPAMVKVSSPLAILTSFASTGLPPRLRNSAVGVAPASLTWSQ